MKYRLIVKSDAELDILESAKWYEDKREGLGTEFIDEVENKLKLIQEAPLHYQIRYKAVRFGLTNRFPCAVHFTVEEDKVIVLAVLGTGEDPLMWK